MSDTIPNGLLLKCLGQVDYLPTLTAMQNFVTQGTEQTSDEIWLLEHPPTLTQGQAGQAEHLLIPTDIPVIQVDRGGQITYHGPGQLVAYTLIHLPRRKLKVRELVNLLEEATLRTLSDFGLTAHRQPGAPGIYVHGEKIASLGLRIKNGWSYHGLALNIHMDLSPFQTINPCGYPGLKVVQLHDFGIETPVLTVGQQWAIHLSHLLPPIRTP